MKTLARFLIVCLALLMVSGVAVAQRNRNLLAIPDVAKKDLICFALYTVHDGTLKLTAQLYPLSSDDPRTVRLEVEKDGKWVEIARTNVIEQGWTAPFRVENWDDTQAVKYRVRHGKEARYEGLIRKNPVDKDEIVVAGFTGNSGFLAKKNVVI